MKRSFRWLILGLFLLAGTALAAAQTTEKPATPPTEQPAASTPAKPGGPAMDQPAPLPPPPPGAPPGPPGRRGMGSGLGRFFNPKTVETLTGEVIKVQRGPLSPGGRMNMVRFTLKTDKESIEVFLGPAKYVDAQPVKLKAKDKVEVKGSRQTLPKRGTTIITAATVTKGNQVLELRDEEGSPLWPPMAGGQGRKRQASPAQ